MDESNFNEKLRQLNDLLAKGILTGEQYEEAKAKLEGSQPLIALAHSLPFPLAFVFKESVLEANDDEKRVRGIIQTFTTGIQYVALICASEYARANYLDERLSWSMERLKRPLISDFFNFVKVAVDSLAQHNVAPLVFEMKEFAIQMEQIRVSVPVMVDDEPREQSLLLRKALVELRNTLGHKLYKADWGKLATQYLPHLEQFLSAIGWCAEYPLLRVLDDQKMARLTGTEPHFDVEPLPTSAHEELSRARAEGELTGLLLTDRKMTRFLNLYPLMLIAPCEECQAEQLRGLTEETFLFNGDEGKFLVYLGMRHTRNTERVRDEVDALYYSKKTFPPVIRVNQITPSELSQRAERQAEQMLIVNINARRYLPQVYHTRPEIEASLRVFLRSTRAGFFLLGESGIGKTSLLCHKVEEWSGRLTQSEESAATGDIVLFYQGRGLLAQGMLEERLVNDLYLEGSFQELLNRLRPTGRRLVLVIDGINEDENPAQTLQAVCQFVTRYGRMFTNDGTPAPLKVVFSFRTAFYDKTLQALGYTADDDEMREMFPSDVFLTHEVAQQGLKRQTYRFELEAMSVEEAASVYENYRSFEGVIDEVTSKRRRFSPTTSFESLSQEARQLLTHPWHLRMALEAFDARPLPASLWVGELLEEFCKAKIYGRSEKEKELFADRADFIDALVPLMRERKTVTIERADLLLEPQLARAVSELQLRLSPYLQLIDEGVLLETIETETLGHRTRKRFLIRFAFDSLLEYLLSDLILRDESLRIEDVAKLKAEKLVATLEESRNFQPLKGAIRFLLSEELTRGFYAGFVKHVRACDREWSDLFAVCLDRWFQTIHYTDSEWQFWDMLGMLVLAAGETGYVVLDTLCLKNFERSRFEVAYRLACLVDAGCSDILDNLGLAVYRFMQAKILIHWGQHEIGRDIILKVMQELEDVSSTPRFSYLLINCKAYLGMAEASMGFTSRAIEVLEEAWQEIKERETDGQNMQGVSILVGSMLVSAYRQSGKTDEAEGIEIGVTERVVGDPENIIGVAMGKAGLLRDRKNYDEAIKVLREALRSVIEDDVSPEALAKAYNVLGISLAKACCYDEARQAYKKSVKIAEDNKLWGTLSFALADLGFLEVELFSNTLVEGQKTKHGKIDEDTLPWHLLDQADANFQRSLMICETFKNAPLEAEIFRYFAAIAAAKKDVLLNEEYKRKEINHYLKLHDYQKVFQAFEDIIDTFNRIGDYDKSVRIAHEALEIAENTQQTEIEAHIRCALIDVYSTNGLWKKAIDVFEGWNNKTPLYKNAKSLGAVLVSFGDVYETELNDIEKAMLYYQDAIEVFEKSDSPSMAINPRLRLANLCADAGQISESLSAVKKVLQDAPSFEDIGQRAHILAGAGQLLYKLRQYVEASFVFLDAIEATKAADDNDLAELLRDNWLIAAETMAKREIIFGKYFAELEIEKGDDETNSD